MVLVGAYSGPAGDISREIVRGFPTKCRGEYSSGLTAWANSASVPSLSAAGHRFRAGTVEENQAIEGGTGNGKTAANSTGAAALPRWHLHRRLYDWVLHWADTRYGTPALFCLSLAESSFFPIPPDVLLAPLVLGNRTKWVRFALACSVASVVGGILGYVIGMGVWSQIDQTVFAWHLPGINETNFAKATDWYGRFNFWIVFVAGFTPLPYKVITISAGVFFKDEGWSPFLMFMFASAVSRSTRFFMVAGLMGRLGPRIAPILDKYFNLACVLFVALLVGGFLVIKYAL